MNFSLIRWTSVLIKCLQQGLDSNKWCLFESSKIFIGSYILSLDEEPKRPGSRSIGGCGNRSGRFEKRSLRKRLRLLNRGFNSRSRRFRGLKGMRELRRLWRCRCCFRQLDGRWKWGFNALIIGKAIWVGRLVYEGLSIEFQSNKNQFAQTLHCKRCHKMIKKRDPEQFTRKSVYIFLNTYATKPRSWSKVWERNWAYEIISQRSLTWDLSVKRGQGAALCIESIARAQAHRITRWTSFQGALQII